MGDNPTAPTVIGRYQIRRRLGEGGMGVVYLAYDPAMDCDIAIKLLRDAIATDDLRKRFAREAMMARRVGVHPHVVTIFDIGEHDGRSFIAMEYVAGETLEHVIHHGTLPSMPRRLEIVEELCVGLMHAHKAGLVHRDIKPANIMIAESGAVKILDFGVARLADSDLTADGVVIGALNYMSPEQMTGTPLDARSDVFAVGAVFYELLSGKRAFPGSLREGLPYRIIHGSPPPLAQLVDQLDPEIERIVQRALEKDPATRYPDVVSMRTDIARVRRRLEAALGDGTDGDAATAVITPVPASISAIRAASAVPGVPTPVPTATPVPMAAPVPPPAARSRGPLVVAGVAVLIAAGAIAWVATRPAPVDRPPQAVEAKADMVLAAPPKPQPVEATPAVAKSTTPAPQPTQAATQTPPKPTPVAAANASNAVAAGEAEILRAMREFSAAWNRRDVDGVKKVFPAFAGAEAPRFQNFELEFDSPRVTIDGGRAEVQTAVRHIPRSATGKDRPARVNDAVFHFVQRDNRWVMLGNQPVDKELGERAKRGRKP